MIRKGKKSYLSTQEKKHIKDYTVEIGKYSTNTINFEELIKDEIIKFNKQQYDESIE